MKLPRRQFLHLAAVAAGLPVLPDRVHLSKYAFGIKTAEFHVCTAGGVVPVVTSRIDGRLYPVVSVNAFENVEPALLRRAPATFEGENEQARLSRRKRNWIADVQFDAAS